MKATVWYFPVVLFVVYILFSFFIFFKLMFKLHESIVGIDTFFVLFFLSIHTSL